MQGSSSFFYFLYVEILLWSSIISLLVYILKILLDYYSLLLYIEQDVQFLFSLFPRKDYSVIICTIRIVFLFLIFIYIEVLLWSSIISLFSIYRAGSASSILRLSTEGFLQLTLNSGAERRITPLVLHFKCFHWIYF